MCVYLVRGDVFAAADNDFLFTAIDAKAAVFVDIPQVPAAEPSVVRESAFVRIVVFMIADE